MWACVRWLSTAATLLLLLGPLVDGFKFGGHTGYSGGEHITLPRISQLHLSQPKREPIFQDYAAPLRRFGVPVLQAAPSSAASKSKTSAKPQLTKGTKQVAKKSVSGDNSNPFESRDLLAEMGVDVEKATQLYDELKSEDGTVAFDEFLNHDSVQQLLEDGSLDLELIKKYWKRFGGGKSFAPLPQEGFLEVQMNLDKDIANGGKDPEVIAELTQQEANTDQLEGVERFIPDPYAKSFDPKQYYDQETIEFLTAEFQVLTGGKKDLSFEQLQGWTQLQAICANNSISSDIIHTMWEEATSKTSDKMSLNTFIRLNVRLEGILFLVAPPTPEAAAELRAQYDAAFASITGNQTVATFDQTLKWSEVQDLLEQKILTKDQFKDIFEELANTTLPKSTKKGIDVEAFIQLDQRLSEMYEPDFDFGDEYDDGGEDDGDANEDGEEQGNDSYEEDEYEDENAHDGIYDNEYDNETDYSQSYDDDEYDNETDYSQSYDDDEYDDDQGDEKGDE